MVSDIKAHVKQRCVTEFLCAEKVAPVDVHRHLLKIYGDQREDMSTVRQGLMRFTSCGGDIKDSSHADLYEHIT